MDAHRVLFAAGVVVLAFVAAVLALRANIWPTPLTAREMAGIYEITQTTRRVLDRRGVIWWADAGTLLGAVRGGAIVPWDDDSDICAMEAGFDPVALREDFRAEGMELTDEGFWKVRRVGETAPWLDIMLVREEGGVIEPATEKHRADWPKSRFPVKGTFPLRAVKLGPTEVYAPRDAEGYLERRYGKAWRRPLYYGRHVRPWHEWLIDQTVGMRGVPV